jgi:hypothetical protein
LIQLPQTEREPYLNLIKKAGTGSSKRNPNLLKKPHKMAKNRNYIPHNEHRHVETRRTDQDWENYLWKLSKTVGDACDRFFVSRGMTPGSVEVRTDAWKKRNEVSSDVSTMKSPIETDSKSCEARSISGVKIPIREA